MARDRDAAAWEALSWVVEYVGGHPDFFPDGDSEGDHAEGEWFHNALAIVAGEGGGPPYDAATATGMYDRDL